jgi:hypothetical protein
MQDCLECGRGLRANGHTADDRPGTVTHYGRGLCKMDWKRLHKSGTLDTLYPAYVGEDGAVIRSVTIPRDRPEPCESCGKNMRPPGTTLTEFPDTVIRKGRTCGKCAHARQKSQHGRPAISTAADIRKMRDDLKEWFASRGRDWRLAGIPA